MPALASATSTLETAAADTADAKPAATRPAVIAALWLMVMSDSDLEIFLEHSIQVTGESIALHHGTRNKRLGTPRMKGAGHGNADWGCPDFCV